MRRNAVESATIADMLPALIEAEERAHVTRCGHVRVQRGWVAVAAAVEEKQREGEEKAEKIPVRGVLDGPSFDNMPAFPSANLGHPSPDDWLSQSRDSLARKHNDFIDSLLNGPWV